jgi:hypothetical protein
MIQKIFGIDFDTALELTFTVIVLYLVLSKAQGFSSMVRSMSSAYTSSVKALQGR